MSLSRRQFLLRAGAASIVGPAVLATTGRAAFAHFGAQSYESRESKSSDRRLSLLPKAKVNLVGNEHAVSARLWPPLAGELVRFEVSSGPNMGDGAELATDARGRVTFVYLGDDGPGRDVITARADNGLSGELTATATKEWVEISAISAVTLSPASGANRVGDTHEVRAQLTPAVGGVPIHFEVTSGPNAPLVGMVVSDDQGRATFSYLGDGGEGIDEIVAWVDVNGSGTRDAGDPQATASKEWLGISSITDVELTPVSATSPLGSSHKVRAKLTPALGGIPVRFEVLSGPNAGLSDVVDSDARGRASFSYVGNGGLGIDEIVAWVDVNGSGAREATDPQATATNEWVEPSESSESSESAESDESPESDESHKSGESRESRRSRERRRSSDSGERFSWFDRPDSRKSSESGE